MSDKQYLHWSQAGGPNECEHGYAEGIPCPNCDANPRIVELRAEIERRKQAFNDMFEDCTKANAALRAENERLQQEVERLLIDNAELSDECDQWERKQEQSWQEIADLRDALARAN
jgi:predicted RNase H-like nuclease (RuvC/YqgF family)